jgi:hypothetical protein
LVVERKLAEFFDELARDNFGKCHEPDLQVWVHGEVAWNDLAPSAVQTQEPKMKVVATVESVGWLDDD